MCRPKHLDDESAVVFVIEFKLVAVNNQPPHFEQEGLDDSTEAHLGSVGEPRVQVVDVFGPDLVEICVLR